MKKRIIVPALIASIFATSLGALASSLAWFNNKSKINPSSHLGGSSDGAYFGGGDGSDDSPFQIKTPRHLYNLAWLQYIGYFNRDEKNNSTGQAVQNGDGQIDKQYHFILSNNIDMSGWKIPPIGTSLYPFVGEFDGNNKTISNLMTTNRYQDYNKVPSSVKSTGSVSNINIVGFFGVVGTMGNTEGYITSNGHTYTYDTSAVSITNFGLDNFTAKTIVNDTLIGLVAGYVNGPISGVAVKGSKITTTGNTASTYTNKLSDYSLAGYIKNNTYRDTMLKKDVQAETPTVENETQSGSGDSFGASIAMSTMYNRLLGLKNAATTNYYNTSETYYDNVLDDSKSEKTEFKVNSNSFVSNSETDSQGRQISSFTFYDRGSGYNAFMYLYGDKSTSSYSYTRTDYTSATAVPTNGTQFYIRDGNNYLRYNAEAFGNGTRDNATLWTYNNGKIYNGSTYLRNNNGTLEASNSSNATTWTFTYRNNAEFTISSEISGTNYYISFEDGSWPKLDYVDSTTRYLFSYNGHYMNLNIEPNENGRYQPWIYSTDDVNEATEWIMTNNNTYYAKGYSTWIMGYCDSTWTMQAYSDTVAPFIYENDGYLGARYNNRYYYAKYGEEKWTSVNNTNQNTAKNNATVVTRTTAPVKQESDFYVGLYQYSQNTSSKTYTSPATYFPLSYEETSPGVYTNNIASKNTGYVVSGTNYTTQPSDMRVSEYAISNLSNACNGNTYNSSKTNVVTVNYKTGNYAIIQDEYNKNNATINGNLTSAFGNTRTTVANLGLMKYNASRTQLHNVLNGASNVYGLHFMDAAISASNKITVPYASINGQDYTDYELPRDSVDFNLKNYGYINFFAGSYFSGNSTFFSLHNIIRSGNTITDIKQISKIYKNTGSDRKTYKYTYLYTDGSYNTNVGTHTELLFDMDWVTNPTMVTNALYYYEIPANRGEYALGSVSGKDGAYLIYLDIGAGVKTQNITTYTEKITTTTETYYFLKGMDFVAVMPSDFSTITGGASANIAIPASTNGNITFSLNGTTNVLACGPPNGTTLTASFISNEITVTSGGSPLTATYVSSSTTVVDKVTSITYDNSEETVSKTVTTTTTVDGVAGDPVTVGPTVIQEEIQEYEAPAVIDGIEQTIVHFHYQVPSGGTVTITEEYDSNTDTYSFTITTTVAIIVHIDSVLESYEDTEYTVKINGTTVSDDQVLHIAAS